MSVFPTKVLLATDGSEDAELANSMALDLAKITGSDLHVVTVIRNPAPVYGAEASFILDYEQLIQELEQEARKTLDVQVKKIEDAGGRVEQTHVRTGESRDQEIVSLSEELGVGLIIMGSRGLGGMKRALMGSVSDSVVRHAHCPVMVVRN